MNRYNKTDKVADVPPLVSKRLLDQVRERIRYLHYSLKTEKAYLYWVRFFVLWSAQQGGMRHPRDMGGADVEAFLIMLANERQVSPATHRQALIFVLLAGLFRCAALKKGPLAGQWQAPFGERRFRRTHYLPRIAVSYHPQPVSR